MPSFKVAHIKEQGQDMLLFPLSGNFGLKSPQDQTAVLATLQARAKGAGLPGHAVAVWEIGGQTHSIGPDAWRGYLSGLSMQFVMKHAKLSISW
jgi:hypothetical protein